MRPILLLEINEVPMRVWKRYADRERFPNVHRLVTESALIETRITDAGELSPWCTWPTFHRGLSKREHGILHLGQDPSTYRGVPLWEEFRSRGYAVGVFGSLQSWPPKDPGAGGFFVPDTFSPDERCLPTSLEPLQAFNLSMVRENARVMTAKAVSRPPGFTLLLAMLAAGVRVKTLARIAAQLIAERADSSARERRVSFQALLFWDVFRSLFDAARPPAFSTFFTNHIASVMHRYWHHIFPEDFPGPLQPSDRRHAETMNFAIGVLDEFIGDVLAWRARNPDLILVVANSMGQRAVIRDRHEGFELLLRDPLLLLRHLGLADGVKQNLAMMPQVSVEVADRQHAETVSRILGTVTTMGGKPLLNCDCVGNSVSITALTPRGQEIKDGLVRVNGNEFSISAAGFVRAEVDAGTAYHEPEGLIFAHGLPESAARPARIDATQAKSLIMGWAGL